MTIRVAYDPDTGEVVIVNHGERRIYSFSPASAELLADRLIQAARSGTAILITTVDDEGQELQIGGLSADALSMAADLSRQAQLARSTRSLPHR